MQATSTNPGPTSPCGDFVAQVRPEDVAQLFTELRKPLFRYLLSLSLSPSEADDVVQEAFLRLCQQFNAGACFNLRSWLFRVAHNLAFDQHRRRLREPFPPATAWPAQPGTEDAALDLASQVADPRATPEQQVIADQRGKQLEAALGRLPPHQQHCLHLRAEGLRYREIAEVLGVGTSTVADWIQAALERLGRDLK